MKTMKALLFLTAAGLTAVVCAQNEQKSAPAKAATAVRELTAINIEYEGSKVWVPSTFIVKKGEKVRLTLINNTTAPHGFSIDEVGIQVVVADKGKKVVEFTADKAGLFRSYCQIHPAHIGGELLVIE